MKRSGGLNGGGVGKRQRSDPSSNLLNFLEGLGLKTTTTLEEVEALEAEERVLAAELRQKVAKSQKDKSDSMTVAQEMELSSLLEKMNEDLSALSARELLISAAKRELERQPGAKKAAPTKKLPKKSAESSEEDGKSSSEGVSGSSSEGSSSGSSGSDSEESSEGEEVAHDSGIVDAFGRQRRAGKKPAGARRPVKKGVKRGSGSSSDSSHSSSGSGSEGSEEERGVLRAGRHLRKTAARRGNKRDGSASESEGEGEVSSAVKYGGGRKAAAEKARARDRARYASDSDFDGDSSNVKGRVKMRKGGAIFEEEDESDDDFDDGDGAAETVSNLHLLKGILGEGDNTSGQSGASSSSALRSLLRSSAPDTSTASLEDINTVRMSRQQALSHLGAPYFSKLAQGCFVKIAKLPPLPPAHLVEAGQASNYRVCRVHAVGNGLRSYDPWKSDGGVDRALLTRPNLDKTQVVRKTNLVLHLAIGSNTEVPTSVVDPKTTEKRIENRPRLAEIHALSDRQITPLEWKEYTARCAEQALKAEKDNVRPADQPLTKADIRRKLVSAATQVAKSAFRESEVERSLARKEGQLIDQIRTMPNITYLRAKYETERAVVEEDLASCPREEAKRRALLQHKINSYSRIVEAVEKETERRRVASQAQARSKIEDSGLGFGGKSSASALVRDGGSKKPLGLSSLSTTVNAKFREKNASRLRAAADDDRNPVALSKEEQEEFLGYVRQKSQPQSLFNVNSGTLNQKPVEEKVEKKGETAAKETLDIKQLMEGATLVVAVGPALSSAFPSQPTPPFPVPHSISVRKPGLTAVGEGGREGPEDEELDLFSEAPQKKQEHSKPAGISFAEFKARRAALAK